MTKPIKYLATLTNVREVTLRGTADFSYWQNRLAPYDLTPADRGGRAPILIIAANMAYMGIRFTEISFSVEVVPPQGFNHPNAVFLIHAFNTSPMLACCERIFFGTPYDHADCRISTSATNSIQVVQHKQPLFQAEMRSGLAATPQKPPRIGSESWEGPIFLPKKSGVRSARHYVFYGKMHGEANVYPFDRQLDVVSISPAREAEVFQQLIDSDFSGEEWSVKEDATHARSKTYRR
jgi:hypothetical protein